MLWKQNAREMWLQVPPLLLLKRVERGDGFEAWRFVVERYGDTEVEGVHFDDGGRSNAATRPRSPGPLLGSTMVGESPQTPLPKRTRAIDLVAAIAEVTEVCEEPPLEWKTVASSDHVRSTWCMRLHGAPMVHYKRTNESENEIENEKKKNQVAATAAFTVAFWRTTTRQRCRSSQRQLCGKRTTHQATTVRPRGTGRRRTFITPSLVGLHSLQTWPRWTTASGRPWSPRFQRSVFRRRLLSKQPLPVHLLWSRDVPDKAGSAFKNRLQQCLDADGGHFEA